jgi:hypothetical protein
MAFESLAGIKIKDPAAKRTYIIADFFSVYEKSRPIPEIYQWSDFSAISETREAFVFGLSHDSGGGVFSLPMELFTDPSARIRVRAIIEGAVAANPEIEYSFGKRILPPKTLCAGCEIPQEAFVATGAYTEGEVNNSNVILRSPGFDKLIWIFAPIALIAAFIAQAVFFGNMNEVESILKYFVIAVFAGAAAGTTAYLLSAYSAKSLYRKILREDPALLEDITFVVCEDGFMASETEVYDFSDIIHWHKAEYFLETNHLFVIYSNEKSVFWLPKRLFPKEIHQELGDFIADRIQQKNLVKLVKAES